MSQNESHVQSLRQAVGVARDAEYTRYRERLALLDKLTCLLEEIMQTVDLGPLDSANLTAELFGNFLYINIPRDPKLITKISKILKQQTRFLVCEYDLSNSIGNYVFDIRDPIGDDYLHVRFLLRADLPGARCRMVKIGTRTSTLVLDDAVYEVVCDDPQSPF